jgi:hypothetical protein
MQRNKKAKMLEQSAEHAGKSSRLTNLLLSHLVSPHQDTRLACHWTLQNLEHTNTSLFPFTIHVTVQLGTAFKHHLAKPSHSIAFHHNAK